MCGIVGIVGRSAVNQHLYDALTVMQHRGQDAAGIVTSDRGVFRQRKGNGLVRDVFRTEHMERLTGNLGIGHTRYPTAGSASSALAQPFYVNSPYGICLGHNGNLTNADQLREQVATLAVAGAERILRREIDANRHAELLTGLKAELR